MAGETTLMDRLELSVRKKLNRVTVKSDINLKLQRPRVQAKTSYGSPSLSTLLLKCKRNKNCLISSITPNK